MPDVVLDVVVVGAGQAGLGVSYYLARAGVAHRVLERGRIGECWRTQRWDAFLMNSVNAQTVMPGQRYDGPDPEGFMGQHGWVALLEAFVEVNRLPVETGAEVTGLACAENVAGAYRLETPSGTILARNVVIASGARNRPRVPTPLAGSLPSRLLQLHAADYRNAAALPGGAVLVVGAGQSGCQIAEDLLDAGRTVYLATCRIGRLPRRYRGRDAFVWLHESNFYDAPPEVLADPSERFRSTHSPQIGSGRTVSLQSLSAQGAVPLSRLAGADGGRLYFADDLVENMRFADEASEDAKRRIDAYIASAGLRAPPAAPDPAETVPPRLPDPPIRSLDPGACDISAVVWCTGFDADFSWLRLPGALDGRGVPAHKRGVTAWSGVYFTGLPWLSVRRSALVTGIALDAPRIAEVVADRCR